METDQVDNAGPATALPPGFLTDGEIVRLVKEGSLIAEATWERQFLRHSSYMLRLGHEVRIRLASDSVDSEHSGFHVRALEHGQPFDVPPGATALLYSTEHLDLPRDVLAFTVARGLLFAEALCPENTYVDPGFNGSIYTTVTNVSGRTLRLHCGMPICRIFFYRLSKEVDDPYRSGASMGIKQQLESIVEVDAWSPEKCKAAKLSELVSYAGQLHPSGPPIVELVRRARIAAVLALVAAFMWPILITAVNGSWLRRTAGPLLANVGMGILASAVWALLYTHLIKRQQGRI